MLTMYTDEEDLTIAQVEALHTLPIRIHWLVIVEEGDDCVHVVNTDTGGNEGYYIDRLGRVSGANCFNNSVYIN